MIQEDTQGETPLELSTQDEEIVDRIRGFGLKDKVNQMSEAQARQQQRTDYYDSNVKGGQSGDGDTAKVNVHQGLGMFGVGKNGMAQALQLSGRRAGPLQPQQPLTSMKSSRDENNDDDGDELEQIRASRLAKMKEMAAMRNHWKKSGHGKYIELNDMESFFKETKKPERCVVLMHREDKYDEDLHNWCQQMSERHLECKFFHIRRDRCEQITRYLKLQGFPTLLLFHHGRVVEWVHPNELELAGPELEKCLQRLEILVKQDNSESESDGEDKDDNYSDDGRTFQFHNLDLSRGA